MQLKIGCESVLALEARVNTSIHVSEDTCMYLYVYIENELNAHQFTLTS